MLIEDFLVYEQSVDASHIGDEKQHIFVSMKRFLSDQCFNEFVGLLIRVVR